MHLRSSAFLGRAWRAVCPGRLQRCHKLIQRFRLSLFSSRLVGENDKPALSMPNLMEQRHGIELLLQGLQLGSYFLWGSRVSQQPLAWRRWSSVAFSHQGPVTALLQQLERGLK